MTATTTQAMIVDLVDSIGGKERPAERPLDVYEHRPWCASWLSCDARSSHASHHRAQSVELKVSSVDAILGRITPEAWVEDVREVVSSRGRLHVELANYECGERFNMALAGNDARLLAAALVAAADTLDEIEASERALVEQINNNGKAAVA